MTLARALHAGADGFRLVQRNYMMANHIVDWTPNDGSYPEGDGYPGFIDNPLVRLFRNSPEIRFLGSVHETVDPARMPARFRWKSLPVVIHHYGKLREPERMAAKQRLYLDLGLKKAVEEPSNTYAYVELGFQYHELGRFSEASECFEKAFEMAHLPRMLLYRAISEKQLLNYSKAVHLLHQAVELGLNTYDVAIELGNIHMQLGQTAQAYEEFQKSFRLNPSSHLAAFNCGLAARRVGDPQAAAGFYGSALKIEPNYVKASLELASLKLENGCFDEALGLLKPLVARNPNDEEARLNLVAAFLSAGQGNEALETLKALDPSNARVQYLLGTAHLQNNDLDLAQHHLDIAVKKDRTLNAARMNLAEVYRLKGDHARAARFLMSAKNTGKSKMVVEETVAG